MTKHYANKRVLITGGLGFIGSNLARTLVRAGAKVTLIDNLSPGCGGNRFNVAGIERKLRIVPADARDPATVRPLAEGQDYLFNLAGQTSHQDSMLAPFEDLHVNCEAPLAALEACRQVNRSIRIVFASTRQVYGRPRYFPVDEKHPVLPVDINGVHKLAGEYYHQLYSRVHGLRTTVLRLTNTIGPRMHIRDARQTFLGVWIRCIMEERPFEVWGGSQLRDFTYVDDAVAALLAAGLSGHEAGDTFNLGGDRVISLRDFAEMLVAARPGARFEVRRYPASRKAIDIGDYFADDRKIRDQMGWRPKIPLPTAVSRILRYFDRHWREYV
jgi:UDP-glucose 4-epimerase